MQRSTRMLMAEETVAIVERGTYRSASGREVDIGVAVRDCLDATRYYSPQQSNAARRIGLARGSGSTPTRCEVVNETTLAGIARLHADGATEVGALNFASARNPGGGFLRGSWAQEESLAISSALYASLLQAPEFHDRHRVLASLLYSDAMVVSPACPIFRDDAGLLLDEPIGATFVTSPAPNAGAIADKRSREAGSVESTLRRRTELILAVAAAAGVRNLVLGAWGCGVFRNDAESVARSFADPLRGVWSACFDRVIFAVLDHSADRTTIRAFADVFGVAA